MAKKGKKPAPKKSAYKRPPPIPKGEVLTDSLMNKSWTLGETVGIGGFGDIYSACPNEGPDKGLFNYVVKVEPYENGPLFVEKHFYIRNAKENDIAAYMKANKLKTFGMPTYFGRGSHERNGEKYRFLVLERYGTNIWDHFEKCKRSFSPDTVFLLGLQMLDVLEYIHGRKYVHADIKGGNILMGRNPGKENQAYLVDYGLATRLVSEEFNPNPKGAHDGTLEYISRDGHLGGSTMRGDLEILAYNLLHWLIGTLPWQKSSYAANTVTKMKRSFMDDVRNVIKKDYPHVPDALIKFFEYINTLEPMDKPDYTICKKIFLDFLKSVGKNKNSKLEFKQFIVGNNDSGDVNPSDNVKVPAKKVGKKPKAIAEKIDDSENVRPDETDEKIVSNKGKRKSAEPQQPPVKTKRLKKDQKVTPQTSIDEPEDTVKDAPKGRALRPRLVKTERVDYINASDSESDDFDETDKKIAKKKPAKTVRELKNKVVRAKKGTKSWKDEAAIVNGRGPKK